MRLMTVSMMCRVCVIISPQAYQPRWDIRWGREFYFDREKAIRETLWLLIESPEGAHASTLLFLVCVSPTKAIRLTELRVSKKVSAISAKMAAPRPHRTKCAA
jgi:hypothetical protein